MQENELSRQRLKDLAALKQKKFRSIGGTFLAEGILLVEELLKSDYVIEELVYNPYLENRPGFSELLQMVRSRGVEPVAVPGSVLKKISTEQNPQGVVAVSAKREFTPGTFTGHLLLCDQIQDPGNLGTLFRIAHWFGLGGIILTQGCVEPTNPKVVRASMGSFFHMPYHHITVPEEISNFYPEHRVFLTTPHDGTSVADLFVREPFILAIGNETRGLYIDDYPNGEAVTLPRLGGAESLNAAIAAASILSRILV